MIGTHKGAGLTLVILAVVADAVPANAQDPSRANLNGVSLSVRSGDDGLRDDSRIDVIVRYRRGVVREIATNVVGSDARNAELHYDNVGDPPTFTVGPVSSIDAIGLRFRQGRGGGVRGPDNFTMTFLSITLTGQSGSHAWEVSVRSDVAHRFRGDEDYFPAGLSVVTRPILCTLDSDCDDGVFCAGVERCSPGDPAADPRGCVTTPACDQKDFCSEIGRACWPDGCQEPDADGDGRSRVECGGDDCDDGDGARYPGNPEVCDAEHRDEDCDPGTFGSRDTDRDGHVDNRCCNAALNGSVRCGTDCDDLSVAIVPGAQVCGAQGGVLVCSPSGKFEATNCLEGDSCVAQPNGLGLCQRDPCACKAVP